MSFKFLFLKKFLYFFGEITTSNTLLVNIKLILNLTIDNNSELFIIIFLNIKNIFKKRNLY